MIGRKTDGLKEAGHFIGWETERIIDAHVLGARDAMAQAHEFAKEQDFPSTMVAIEECYARITRVFHDIRHARACLEGLPCDCHNCTTTDERIAEIDRQTAIIRAQRELREAEAEVRECFKTSTA